jgi:hypothetical protein
MQLSNPRRINFQWRDLSDGFPEGTFDLVAAHYLHSPVRLDREHVLRRGSGRRRWALADC